jgi:hypothetical protein
MKSKVFSRRKTASKKATVLVSRETLEQAVQEANTMAEHMMETNANDARLDELDNTVAFLSSILTKNPAEMQQEGFSSLEDYLDDAKAPEIAQKVKQGIDMIQQMRNAVKAPTMPGKSAPSMPAMASGSDNFITDREDGKTKTVEASGSDNFVNDRNEDGKPETPEVAEVPRIAAAAAPVAPAVPTPTPDPVTGTNVLDYIPTDMILKMVEDMPKEEGFAQNKGMQDALIELTNILKSRPVEAAPLADGEAAPAPVTASFLGLHIASADEDGGDPGDEDDSKEKKANAQGGSFVTNQDTSSVVENGGRTPEIAQAHGLRDDNTGIARPKTELPGKFAADMNAKKALKLAEDTAAKLKAIYLEAKPMCDVNDTRPVREAVESIYKSMDMFGEAIKTISKMMMAEEAEAEAMAIKEKNTAKKSAFLGLALVATED